MKIDLTQRRKGAKEKRSKEFLAAFTPLREIFVRIGEPPLMATVP